ncbi:VOC family protein [Pedobacter sp. MW01-1-1]|uniref:VOC family protein n=1 Tax=Pedobacter sp. MW01-1-1 TaxID=3383027 RepID=UPI003FF1568E
MIKSAWINLPVQDIQKSKEFFTKIGFRLNANYGSNNDSACFLIGEGNFVLMLFTIPLFESFVSTKNIDTASGVEYLLSFDAESPEEVDEIAQKVKDAGGTLYAEPGYKDGWMYGCGFCDLDGHRWNILYMDFTKNK